MDFYTNTPVCVINQYHGRQGAQSFKHGTMRNGLDGRPLGRTANLREMLHLFI